MRERESKKVCVFKCMCVCTRTRMCVCTCALAWMSVCTGVKCYMNVSLYRGEMLHECQSVKGWNVTWMSVCTGVKCYMNVSLYRGEMLQLPCPRVHETHVMQIELILIKAWHVTSRTWAIKKNVEIGVLRFCWAGATKFSIFAFKMWWHHMY